MIGKIFAVAFIAGIVVGVIIGVLGISLISVLYCKHKESKENE